jgi:transposase
MQYIQLHAGPSNLVGIEAVGNDQWFVCLLQKLGHEVWVGEAAQIRASYVRKQKTDQRDAKHILQLLVDGRFSRIWIPGAEMRDHRQLLIHRHKRRYARGSRMNSNT